MLFRRHRRTIQASHFFLPSQGPQLQAFGGGLVSESYAMGPAGELDLEYATRAAHSISWHGGPAPPANPSALATVPATAGDAGDSIGPLVTTLRPERGRVSAGQNTMVYDSLGYHPEASIGNGQVQTFIGDRTP